MKVLLIKTSSMGDIIHTFPALTDARLANPHLTFDWVVEEPFAELASFHPAVRHIIPIALRRWRKNLFSFTTFHHWKNLRNELRAHSYDLVLDAQGLVKSALITRLAKGMRAGLDFQSAREGLASFAYQKKYKVNFYQHAIVRMRSLFSLAFNYSLPITEPEFNLNLPKLLSSSSEKYLVFLHGTTWESKEWPEQYWQALANLAHDHGYRVKMSGGNQREVDRAKRIAAQCHNVDVHPFLTIGEMTQLLSQAKASVAVDTGFGHLSAALKIPTVSIYGATNPGYTGAIGPLSTHLSDSFPCAPCLLRECNYKKASLVKPACYENINPQKVWHVLSTYLQKDSSVKAHD